ncbi:hypothetical protein [Thiosocius teredinicola]|uniref:hypothetical protein n=1 Tax=Thiosocius teredinicola TaxID=1973002 RepID=UPI000990D1F1
MRWFVVFLLIANIILFIWVQQHSQSDSASKTQALPEVGRLRLMSESAEQEQAKSSKRDESPLIGTQDYSGSAAESDDDDAGQRATLAQAEARAEENEPTVPQPDGRAVPPGDDLQVAPLADAGPPPEQVAKAPQTEPQVLPEPVAEETADVDQADAPEVTQVEEVGAGSIAEPPEPESLQPAPDAVEPVCARIGPFVAEDADKLLKSMPRFVSLIEDSSESTAVVTGYYVLIPPLPSRADGNSMVKQLADKGIKDTFLFRSGALNNGISLGLFKRESNARRHAKNVVGKGFGAEVRERKSTQERRWLVLKNEEGGEWADTLPLPEGVETQSRACPAD